MPLSVLSKPTFTFPFSFASSVEMPLFVLISSHLLSQFLLSQLPLHLSTYSPFLHIRLQLAAPRPSSFPWPKHLIPSIPPALPFPQSRPALLIKLLLVHSSNPKRGRCKGSKQRAMQARKEVRFHNQVLKRLKLINSIGIKLIK
jgi:hypothetical protein